MAAGERTPALTASRGEFVVPADELAAAFAATFVARSQTERPYARARKAIPRAE